VGKAPLFGIFCMKNMFSSDAWGHLPILSAPPPPASYGTDGGPKNFPTCPIDLYQVEKLPDIST
jgi:hypothetical protein